MLNKIYEYWRTGGKQFRVECKGDVEIMLNNVIMCSVEKEKVAFYCNPFPSTNYTIPRERIKSIC